MLSDFIVTVLSGFFDAGVEGMIHYLQGDFNEDTK
jgi:hypothetical protein